MSALNGIRILELAEDVRGEYCGKLLADFGAEVIKIEAPGRGSPTRQLGPFVDSGPEAERSILFAYLNTNKRSVELDLESAAGSGVLAQLLASVDVVIDDHPRAWLENLGLQPEALSETHPALVFCSLTPFGLDPAEGRENATDLTVFQASGWGYHTPTAADPESAPLKGAGRFMVSYETGLDGALCVSAALYERMASGQGQSIDVSAQAVMASRVDYVLSQMVAGDMDVGTHRTAFDLSGPASIFPCRDGFVYIWMSTPGHWKALGEMMGQPAWMAEFPERWLELECTAERVDQVREHVRAWLADKDKEVVSANAQKLGLTMAAVNRPHDLVGIDQYAHRGYFAELTHPVIGSARYPTVPYRMSATPVTLRTPAPALGEHAADLAKFATGGAR